MDKNSYAVDYFIRRLQAIKLILQSSLVLLVGGFLFTTIIEYNRIVAVSIFILLCSSILSYVYYRLVRDELVIEIESILEMLNPRELVDFANKYKFKVIGNYIVVFNKYIDISYLPNYYNSNE